MYSFEIKALETRRFRYLRSWFTIGALIITYTILVLPYYAYSIMGPKPNSLYLLRPLLYVAFRPVGS